jgi:hypothetical protein
MTDRTGTHTFAHAREQLGKPIPPCKLSAMAAALTRAVKLFILPSFFTGRRRSRPGLTASFRKVSRATPLFQSGSRGDILDIVVVSLTEPQKDVSPLPIHPLAPSPAAHHDARVTRKRTAGPRVGGAARNCRLCSLLLASSTVPPPPSPGRGNLSVPSRRPAGRAGQTGRGTGRAVRAAGDGGRDLPEPGSDDECVVSAV